jgi:AAA+ ATPase superfamily predicted ATPase
VLPRPPGLIDREREWTTLDALASSDRPELVMVLGRRRAGKSFLLAPFASAADGLYHQASRGTEAEQLRALSHALGERFDDAALRHGVPLPDWSALLRYVVSRAGSDAFVLVLDEFPYLEEASPALPSVLQRLVDHELAGSRVKLILSGSHISAMRRIEDADRPLYARRTERIEVQPFGCRDASAFMDGWAPRDRVAGWAVFGGLPGQLALIDSRHDLAWNVATRLLDPSSRLFDEAQRHLDAFLGESAVHYALIEAIAGGAETWQGITRMLGRTSGSVSRPMDWLIDMRLVERVVPITVDKPSTTRRTRYRLTDPYLRFWHRFVAPLMRSGTAGRVEPDRLFRALVEPGLDDYLGLAWEDACRDAAWTASAMPFRPLRVGTWWSARADAEIDLVAIGESGELLVGECRWGEADRHDLGRLRRATAALLEELGGAPSVRYALFSGRPPRDRGLRGEDVLILGAEDVVGPS